MERRFWLERWTRNQIGFHQDQYNARLLKYWPSLNVEARAPVFVPLCGKSKDMHWLASQGHKVIGIELSELAVDAYFEEAREPFEVSQVDGLACHDGETARIYQGDYFDITAPHLKGVKACYDRGSLVALPNDMRARYVDHLLRVLEDGVQMLLLTVEYDQSLVAGPPHSVTAEEVQRLYGERCEIERLGSASSDAAPPHFQAQGVSRIAEAAYRITKVS